MKLADVLKQIWAEADRWNDEEKRAIAALSQPVDGALDCLDKLLASHKLCFVIPHLHDQANIKQSSNKYIQNTRAQRVF